MPTPCTVTGTLYDGSGAKKVGGMLTVAPLTVVGILVNKGAQKPRSATEGAISFTVIQGGRYHIEGNVLGYDNGGIDVTIPSAASATLEGLLAAASVPSEGLTVMLDGDPLANLFGALNFSTAFDVTESPTGQANIDLVGAGILSLNTLTEGAQTLVPGSSGSDFAINSAGSAHTFNLPTASATKRGLLSTTDWSAFNAKASTGYVDSAIAALINSAPGALDTLDELAAALGDDANFAATVTTSLNAKLAKASNLSDLTNAGTARTNLGLAIGTNVQAFNQNLADIAGLVDPNTDRLLFWDDSAGAHKYLALGTNLSITDTTLNAAGGGSSPGGVSGDLQYYDGAAFAGSLLKQSSNLIQQRDGANAQALELFGGYTNGSNNTKLKFDAGGNYKEIMLMNSGAFVQAEIFYISNTSNEGIQFKTNNGSKWKMEAAGHWLPNGANNQYDVGASGNPCRSGYFGTLLSSVVEDLATNTVVNALKAGHQSSGTPTVGFGTGLLFNLKSSITADREAAQIAALWTTATDASRTAELQINIVQNAGALATVAKFDRSATAGDTGLWLWDADNGQLERVTVGAADSGGSGFKVLRIAN